MGTLSVEADLLCDPERRGCPAAASLADLSKLLHRGKVYGCRRELFALSSGAAVQAFSIAELALGLKTASSITRQDNSAFPASRLQYGTTAGQYVPMAMLTLDVMLAVHVPAGLFSPVLARLLPAPLLRATRRKLSSHHVTPERRGFRRHIERWLRRNELWRTFVGFKRLKSLPPASAPLQWIIDHLIVPRLNATYEGRLVKALPMVGDALHEGELIQAFGLNFLASAKTLVLIGSAFKAFRVRQRLREKRLQRAARRLVTALQRARARRQVKALRRKHLVAALAIARYQFDTAECNNGGSTLSRGSTLAGVKSLPVLHKLGSSTCMASHAEDDNTFLLS
eukprot:CAMPEP_0119330366 /NCGR_PEP_ID=MMETSP1333-20130426/78091_1 /TAXON_ID=418940 /ORGANISM="Scyphosphaera apsteinii, Strain RCC1455" /LENGTH=339 /DNA_ID=CAMNT_0007339745 /DNA_START=519 /DNA_END=1539 /DNA_ORIENTATION=+